MKRWDETTGQKIPDDHLLSDEQIARCERADTLGAGSAPLMPIPTQLVSNGEYPPLPQTTNQQRVEARVNDLADIAAQKLGISRRGFLLGSGGMAASFLAMNEIYGPYFDIDPLSMLVPEAYAQSGPPRDLFVFDDQLHMVRGSRFDAAAPLRALAQGPSSTFSKSNPLNGRNQKDEHGDAWGVWNRELVGLPNSPENFLITQFIKDVYLDSQVNVGLLSQRAGGRGGSSRRGHAAQYRRGAEGRDPHRGADRRGARFREQGVGQPAHAGARSAVCGQGQPGLHPPAGRRTEAGFVEGLQHRHLGQGGQRSAEPDAPVAP